VVLHPPLYSINVGYDHQDSGPTNYLSDFAPQGIRNVFGFSETISNL